MGTKLVCKNFRDDLEDITEETNRAKLINLRRTSFFGMRATKV